MYKILFLMALMFGTGAVAQESQFTIHMVPSAERAVVGDAAESEDRAVQEKFGNSVVVVEQTGDGPGEVVEFQQAGSSEELAELFSTFQTELIGSDEVGCISPNPEENLEVGESQDRERTVERGGSKGTRGEGGLPSDFSYPLYDGSKEGGCGTWATMMCNRILGVTSHKRKPSSKEWNDIAKEIKQNPGGGSNPSEHAAYYERRGYCTASTGFTGSAGDYAKVAEKLRDGCDIKLVFFTYGPEGLYDGHVETVTRVYDNAGRPVIETNSWGQPATVTGRPDKNFDHSRMKRNGVPIYPRNPEKFKRTYVNVHYTCPCSKSELKKLISR